ncbi:hypothetical protein KKA95_01685 [Patescibacteria group bacterium]|nr:hypothetical protein [Patescibacteria group bacterium]
MAGKRLSNFQAVVTCLVLALIVLISHLLDTMPTGEEVKDPRFALIQLKAAQNGANTQWLASKGVSIPQHIKDKKNAYQIFPEGVDDDYDEFVTIVIDVLQPKDHVYSAAMSESACRDKRVEGAAMILGASAIGKYQVLLRHHGKYIKGWDSADWEERMKIMYKYIRTPAIQDYVSVCLLRKLRDEHDGDPKQMASAYYSGGGTGSIISLTYWKSWMPSFSGFGSKHGYSNSVAGCYKSRANKSTVETDEDLAVFHGCIARQESGGHAKKGEGK